MALMFGVAACNKNQTPDTSAQLAASDQPQSDQSQDPAAAANLVPASTTTTAAPTSSPTSNAGSQPEESDSDNDADLEDQDSSYGQPVLQAQQPPPALPEYSQPDCPGDGYLWTPGYWGFVGGRYRYHYGYWGQHIGYYGGINYGNRYVGVGYQGGYWKGDRFNYNCSVNNVTTTNVQVDNRTITNTVIVNNTTVNITNNRYSYNGPGGVTRQPLRTEVAATREQRIPPMNTQFQARQEAAKNRQQFASVNKGRPAVLVAAKPIPEGKPIAPIIPARAAAAPRPAPEPNRAEPESKA